MPQVWLTYSDGNYSIRDFEDPKESASPESAYVPDHLYRAYFALCDQMAVVQDALRAIDNEKYREMEARGMCPHGVEHDRDCRQCRRGEG